MDYEGKIKHLFQTVDETRQQRNMSWQAVSRETGVSPGTLTRFIAGEKPSLRNYFLLEEFAEEATENFRDYSTEERIRLAKEGKAMPIKDDNGEIVGGRYPIVDCTDLENAIQAFGRAKFPEKTKAHITKRAKALNCDDVDLPEDWNADTVEDWSTSVEGFVVTGDVTLPIAARDREWDGGLAKEHIWDKFTDSEGNVDVDMVSKAFLRRYPDSDPNLKGSWSLGFADIIGGQLTIVPRGVATVAGGHGIGKLEDRLDANELRKLKIKICQLYEQVSHEYETWPRCPFQRTSKNQDQADFPANSPIISSCQVLVCGGR